MARLKLQNYRREQMKKLIFASIDSSVIFVLLFGLILGIIMKIYPYLPLPSWSLPLLGLIAGAIIWWLNLTDPKFAARVINPKPLQNDILNMKRRSFIPPSITEPNLRRLLEEIFKKGQRALGAARVIEQSLPDTIEEERISTLVEKSLLLAGRAQDGLRALNEIDERDLENTVRELEANLERLSPNDPSLKQRKEILESRREELSAYGKIEDNCDILIAQLEKIASVLGVIYLKLTGVNISEELSVISASKEISDTLGELTDSVNTLEVTLQDVKSIT
jgi:hypothetical protein